MALPSAELKVRKYRRRLIETGYSYYASRVLHAAAEMRLFEKIGRRSLTAARAARFFRADLRGITVFLDALAALGMLRKRGNVYRNSPENLAVHIPGRDSYVGDALRLQGAAWEGWGHLKESILSGKPAVSPPFRRPDRSAVRAFALAMHNTAAGHASDLARDLRLHGRKRLLDLGAGPGTFTAHFLRRYPALRATVYDLPATLRETRSILGRYGIRSRVRFQAGDFLKDPLPAGHDLVFISHIIHGLNESDNRKLLRKVFAAMEKGGEVYIQDFFLDAERCAPEFAALFSLNMLVHTPGGRSYSFAETESWLREAGFRAIRRLPRAYPRSIRVLKGVR
jgi:SAM-dependent methyltransferase